eukprot:512485-Pyramimonas_sp.AAC.1
MPSEGMGRLKVAGYLRAAFFHRAVHVGGGGHGGNVQLGWAIGISGSEPQGPLALRGCLEEGLLQRFH